MKNSLIVLFFLFWFVIVPLAMIIAVAMYHAPNGNCC